MSNDIQDVITDFLGQPRDVLDGDIDTFGRIAWIERAEDTFFLRTAGGGPEISREIETYNPYFGCDVHYMRWWGDDIVSIYREKHRMLVWVVPVSDPSAARLASIPHDHAVHEDLVVFGGDEPGLLRALSIPTLEPRSPVPICTTERWLRISCDHGYVSLEAYEVLGACRPIERVRLPSFVQRRSADPSLADAVADTLGDRSQLVTWCAARPFWTPAAMPVATYHDEKCRGESLRWLPVYWHEHLEATGRGQEAAELLSWLDAISAPAPAAQGWCDGESFEDGVHRLAVEHVRRSSGVLAKVIREHHLPRDHYDYLFGRLAGASRTPDLEGAPPVVQGVWEELAAAKPRSLSDR